MIAICYECDEEFDVYYRTEERHGRALDEDSDARYWTFPAFKRSEATLGTELSAAPRELRWWSRRIVQRLSIPFEKLDRND